MTISKPVFNATTGNYEWAVEQINPTVDMANEQLNGTQTTNKGWNDLLGNSSSARALGGKQLVIAGVDLPTGGSEFATSKFAIGNIYYQQYQFHHGVTLNSELKGHMHCFTSTNPTGKSIRLKINSAYAGVGSQYTVGAADVELEILFDEDISLGNFLVPIFENAGGVSGFNPTVSSIVKISVERIGVVDGTEYTGNFYLDYIDVHVRIDQERGSRNELSK